MREVLLSTERRRQPAPKAFTDFLNGMVFGVRFTELCRPGMGVNLLWGDPPSPKAMARHGSPLYMNPVPSFYDGNESTSRRQAPSPAMASQEGIIVRCRLKEAGVQSCEPSNKAQGSRRPACRQAGRVNAAVVQRKFTLLNRVPSGKFNRVNVLIRGGLSLMWGVSLFSEITGWGNRYPNVPAFSGRAFAGR